MVGLWVSDKTESTFFALPDIAVESLCTSAIYFRSLDTSIAVLWSSLNLTDKASLSFNTGLVRTKVVVVEVVVVEVVTV